MKIRQSQTILLMSLLTFLLPLALAPLATAQETSCTLYVDPPTYQVTQLGEVFTIDINIANVTDLNAFAFKLGYNSTLLDALEAVEGPFAQPASARVVEIHDSEGYVSVFVVCDSAKGGSGTLATITFNATYAEPASCTLQLYDTELYDSSWQPITHDVDDGSYSVIPEFPLAIVTPVLLIATLVAAFLGKMVWSRKR